MTCYAARAPLIGVVAFAFGLEDAKAKALPAALEAKGRSVGLPKALS
jgi:hypothetical protein